MGTKTEGLNVNVFAGSFGGDNVKLAVTDDADCMPMTYLAYGEHGEGKNISKANHVHPCLCSHNDVHIHVGIDFSSLCFKTDCGYSLEPTQ